ncbi:magnesium transporter mgtE [Mycobacteroides abscessus subsp. abscessus]|nr:magnesium transporter mgtE [Mycobacteroides abscessus subsp. abscessus]
MADYNLALIPVVDDGDRVLGVVTYDDVLAALIPQDWRRREPAPRPVRQAASNPDGVAP